MGKRHIGTPKFGQVIQIIILHEHHRSSVFLTVRLPCLANHCQIYCTLLCYTLVHSIAIEKIHLRSVIISYFSFLYKRAQQVAKNKKKLVGINESNPNPALHSYGDSAPTIRNPNARLCTISHLFSFFLSN